ncbi:PfkB family carbohydrate kinase [Rubrivirga sp. S365]|uniref:PfkB family carbohydrate kinase n=1 Tax=Rubrivirga sp. S365 TaxID=3076080 RepID=UPI0028CA3C03|nr:PfkB family carbohydrate kinase [Rubrivirga sp. S365]MDT7858383.1 PfkB family carbohydrate kinase [Rubrivirga sp. S365]
MTASTRTGEILCVGELLWDALPKGLFLGGAPLNVAFHLHALGERVAVVSRVGDDRLGREALRRMADRGVATELVQVDPELDTGFVRVSLDEGKEHPAYTIEQPVAWDALALTGALSERAAGAAAVVFGTLAQRQETARRTVRALGDAAALAVLDVNLRPPYAPRSVVESSLAAADVVKLNEAELAQIGGWDGTSGTLRERAEALAQRFDCRTVCVTRGADGSALWHRGAWAERRAYPVKVKDAVGAGDAFLAALLSGLLAGHTCDDVLDAASRLAAYVATRSGATPEYQAGGIAGVQGLPLKPPADTDAG